MTTEPLISLDPGERTLVLECLRATCEGPFFPDREFSALIGFSRADVALVLEALPDDLGSLPAHITADDGIGALINNAMNNLTGYPHNQAEVWSDYISAPVEEVRRVYAKWQCGQPPPPPPTDRVIIPDPSEQPKTSVSWGMAMIVTGLALLAFMLVLHLIRTIWY